MLDILKRFVELVFDFFKFLPDKILTNKFFWYFVGGCCIFFIVFSGLFYHFFY